MLSCDLDFVTEDIEFAGMMAQGHLQVFKLNFEIQGWGFLVMRIVSSFPLCGTLFHIKEGRCAQIQNVFLMYSLAVNVIYIKELYSVMWLVLKKQNVVWLRLMFQENEFTNINLNM